MKNNYFFVFVFALFISCVPQRKVIYVQSDNQRSEYLYSPKNRKDAQIEPFDVLYISIGSADQPSYNFFNEEKQYFNSLSETSLSVISYSVDADGYVMLPIVGKVRLLNLTLEEAADTIKESVKNYLSTPIVYIRFVNNSVTILGEVLRPGTYIYNQGRLTIFHALGLAGDISEYGNKRKVTLIRERFNTIHKYYLDLTSDEIFNSDFYYLRPNDIVYVEPLKVRRLGMKEFPFSLLLSSITTFILILTYIKK